MDVQLRLSAKRARDSGGGAPHGRRRAARATSALGSEEARRQQRQQRQQYCQQQQQQLQQHQHQQQQQLQQQQQQPQLQQQQGHEQQQGLLALELGLGHSSYKWKGSSSSSSLADGQGTHMLLLPRHLSSSSEWPPSSSTAAGSSSSSSSSGGGVQMDERLWSKFPEDVLDRVIAHLPLSKICQLRSLCKRWKEPHLFSPDFLETLNRRSLHGTYCPLLLRLHNMLPDAAAAPAQGCLAYDAHAKQWRKLPPLACFPSNTVPCGQVTGAAGLLLLSFKRHFLDCINYTVCNPITGQWTELPPLPDCASALDPLLLRMIMDNRDGGGKSYKVVLVEPVRNTYVFDSATGRWSFLAPMPVRPYAANVVCNGALYSVGLGKMGERMAILKCDVAARTWTSLSMPSLKFHYVTHLLEWQSTVLVVIDISSRNRLQVYAISDLEKMVDWLLVAEMPEEFVAMGWPRTATCVADAASLYFSKFHNGTFQMLVFHFGDKKWKHVVDSGVPGGNGDGYHLLRVPFEPNWNLNCDYHHPTPAAAS